MIATANTVSPGTAPRLADHVSPITRILVALDGSPLAERALPFAAARSTSFATLLAAEVPVLVLCP